METEKLQLILILKPHGQKAEATGAWLDNNDPSLLNALNLPAENLLKLKDSTKKYHNVGYIKVRHYGNEFQLYSDNDWVILQHGDIVAVEQSVFAIEIHKTKILVDPDPVGAATAFVTGSETDHWHQPILNQQNPNLNFQSGFQQAETAQDPLTFLFGSSVTKTENNLESVIPKSQGIGAFPYAAIATIQSPMPDMTLKKSTMATASLSNKSIESSSSKIADVEGNILQDLGINQITNHYSQRELFQDTTNKNPAQYAPIDYLEELLGEELYQLQK